MTEERNTFDFSLNLNTGPAPTPGEPANRCMAPPFRAQPINAEACLVHIEGRYPNLTLNVQLVQILSLCDAFRTPDQHVRHIAQTLGWGSQQHPAIKQAIDHLQSMEVLLEESSMLTHLSQQPKPLPDPPPLAHVFIRTADRPQALARLLDSLKTQPTLTTVHVWVLDDSQQPDHVATNSAHTEQFGANRSGPTHCLDRARRRALLTRIAEQSQGDVDQLHWLIEGDQDDPSPSYGASLNLALLLAAGQRFCIIDDDATLDAFVLEDAHPGVDLRGQRQHQLKFIDPDQPEEQQVPKTRIDPMASHAQWLGRSLADITQEFGHSQRNFLGHTTAHMLHQLRGQPSVRLTTNGTLGDPGTSGMTWLFTQPAKDLHALCHQDPSWASRLFNRRFARASLGTQVTTDFSLMTTTLTGIDNRELLLPTVSKGRNEDLLFSVLMKFLYPDALSVSLPFMLPHRPDEPRRWQDEDLDAAKPIHEAYNHMMILADLIESLALPKGDQRSRLAYLAAWLTHFAKLGQMEVKDMMMDYISQLQAEQVKAINDTAGALDAPDWLKQLFARVIAHILSEDAQADEHLLELAKPIQRFAGQYAQSMETWVKAWRWCCQHDMTKELP